MIPNRISEELSQQALDRIMAHVRAIHAELPFLVGLSPKQRMRMNIAGDRSEAFIRKAIDVAPRVDGYLPRSFDADEVRKDVDLRDALQPIQFAVSQLAELLGDTRSVLSAEAFAGAREVYRCAKQAQGPEGLEDVVRELGRRFSRPRPGTDAPTQATETRPAVTTGANESRAPSAVGASESRAPSAGRVSGSRASALAARVSDEQARRSRQLDPAVHEREVRPGVQAHDIDVRLRRPGHAVLERPDQPASLGPVLGHASEIAHLGQERLGRGQVAVIGQHGEHVDMGALAPRAQQPICGQQAEVLE